MGLSPGGTATADAGDRSWKSRASEETTAKKRPRDNGGEGEGEGDGDEDDELLRQLDEDDFVSADERARREAKLRREARRRRLQAVAETQPEEAPVHGVDPTSAVAAEAEAADQTKRGGDEPGNMEDGGDDKDEDDDDGFNMFLAGLDSPEAPPRPAGTTVAAGGGPTASAPLHQQQQHHQEDCDDAEGYYKATIGEVIDLAAGSSASSSCKLRVLGVIGKGVFSTVLKCQVVVEEEGRRGEPSLPDVVALKCVRHNESMAKAAEQEVRILQDLAGSPGVVSLLLPRRTEPLLLHRGHVVLVMEHGECNLRTVLQRFGRGVGLRLAGVRSYFAQLLSALEHLRIRRVVHSDLKPDNVLVAASDFGRVMIADFGSATTPSEQSNVPTPYLVSRYYRAPEIILGLTPVSHPIDTWSIAATVAELFTGSVLFPGRSNNDMLRIIQQTLRVVFPNRTIRRHLRQCAAAPNSLPAHFVPQGAAYLFRLQTTDPVTGQLFHKHLNQQQLLQLPARDGGSTRPPKSLPDLLRIAAAGNDPEERGALGQLADLLHKCLALDPDKRIAPREALKHDFFSSVLVREDGGAVGGNTTATTASAPSL